MALLSVPAAASASKLPYEQLDWPEDLRPALLAVSINGLAASDPMMLLRADDGSVYAPEEAFETWRLKPRIARLEQDGVTYYALNLIPGLQLQIVEATQMLLITAPPELLETTAVSAYSPENGPMTPSGRGGFLNYDLVAQSVAGERSLNALLEAGMFTPFGVATSTFAGRWNQDRSDLIRLETNWTRRDPERMRYLRLGDGISRGGLGANPVRFAGVQLARDFSTQPGFITIPLPSVSAEAEVPSVVDVYVNNILQERRDLPPGPFEIHDVPVVTGRGDIQLVVRDLLGRETLIRQPYYAARQLLRRGLHDFSYEAGLLRENFGFASFDYGSPLVAATHRYGISDSLTAEAHAEATPQAQMGGIGASLSVADAGLVNASAAVSQSDWGVGTRYQLGFESRTARLSYGAVAELLSDDFVSIGASELRRRLPKATIQAFAGMPFKIGSLGLSYLYRDVRDEPGIQMLNATASVRLGRLGTLNLSGRTSLTGPRNDAVLLSLTVPLGARTSASIGGELGSADAIRASLQKSLPPGEGLGYHAAAELGDLARFDGRLSYQTDFGSYDLDVSWVDSRTGIRMSATGGIAIMSGSMFASRKLTQSFATVQVGDYPDVRVYADNQHVATTDASGKAVIPRLRPFEKNALRIELADLPIDAEITTGEQVVRPYDRSGVAVDFAVQASRGAILSLVRDDGSAVPAGAFARLDGSDEEFVVAPGGEAYLTGLAATNTGTASWGGGSCTFGFDFPRDAEPQPRLGPVRCMENG